MGAGEQVSFNINAELYENTFGELAVKFPGEKAFRNVGNGDGARFQKDAVNQLEKGEHPAEWSEMPAHELDYRDWRCIAMLGYVNGDPDRPAVEFEVDREGLGAQAKAYLADAAPSKH